MLWIEVNVVLRFLIFTPLKRGASIAKTLASLVELQFGPLHAAIQMGSVILE